MAVWHRRAGKDSTALNFTATAAHQEVGVYWHLLPTLKQAKKAIWDGIDRNGRRIIDQVFPPEIRVQGNKGKSDSDLQIRLGNGSIWQLGGSDYFDSLVGSNPRGVVFSEWSLTDPRAWDYVRPILLENGGWAVFIYTPRGYNHGWTLYQLAERLQREKGTWFAEILPYTETNVLTQDQIQDELDSGMSQEMVDQEYGCSFEAATPGAYYADVLRVLGSQGRLREIPAEPAVVHTFWDLGIDDSTSIIFAQVLNNQVLVLDYEEHRAHGLEFYANLLREKAMKNEWVYGTHHWPHDGDHKNLATGQKLSFTARKLGIRPLRIQKRLKAEDGIQFVRQILKRCYFNYKEPSTSDVTGNQAGGTWRLVEALRQYRAELDEKSRTYSKKPLHDWTSHPADAMRTLAVSFMPVNNPDESYKTITEGRFHSPTQADLSWEP